MLSTTEIYVKLSGLKYPNHRDFGSKEGFEAAHKNYRGERDKLETEWNEWLYYQYSDGLNHVEFDLVFDKAWSDEHGSGYSEVERCIEELIEFVNKILRVEN